MATRYTVNSIRIFKQGGEEITSSCSTRYDSSTNTISVQPNVILNENIYVDYHIDYNADNMHCDTEKVISGTISATTVDCSNTLAYASVNGRYIGNEYTWSSENNNQVIFVVSTGNQNCVAKINSVSVESPFTETHDNTTVTITPPNVATEKTLVIKYDVNGDGVEKTITINLKKQ
jgi:hypothetical protein